MPSRKPVSPPPSDDVFTLGRTVFVACERAASSDYSGLTAEHVAAALAYGECQLVLWGTPKRVLAALQRERQRRARTYPQAIAALRKVGASKATGDAFRAMLAQTITDTHGGDSARYYAHLTGTDAEVTAKGKALLSDRAKAWDVLMGL